MSSKKDHKLTKGLTFILLTLLFALVLITLSFIYEKGYFVKWFAELREPEWNTAFLLITRLGEVHLYILAIFIFLFFSYRKSALFSLAGILGLVTSFIAKSIFSQARPYKYFSDLDQAQVLGKIDGYEFHSAFTSMPSGHTLAAFAFFFLIGMIGRSVYWQIFAFFLAAIGGISRIYLGQHFMADVGVGSLIGLTIGIISYYMVHTVWENKHELDGSLLKLR